MATEVLSDAISGAASGAKAGAAIGGGVGAAIGSVLGAIGGLFSGRSKRKRRKEAERKARALRRQVVASLNRRGKRISEFYAESKEDRDRQIDKILRVYLETIDEYSHMREQSIALANEKYGEVLSELERFMVDDLKFNSESFQLVSDGINEMQERAVPAAKRDIAENKARREEFKAIADSAIDAISDNIDSLEERRERIENRGGLATGSEGVLATQEGKFRDIQRRIDQADAGRGLSGLTNRKQTALFEEARQKGELLGDLTREGMREQDALSEAINRGSASSQQLAGNRLARTTETDDSDLASLQNQFESLKLQALDDKVSRELGIRDRFQASKIREIITRYGSIDAAERAYSEGKINADNIRLVRELNVDGRFNAIKASVLAEQNKLDAQIARAASNSAAQNEKIASDIAAGSDLSSALFNAAQVGVGLYNQFKTKEPAIKSADAPVSVPQEVGAEYAPPSDSGLRSAASRGAGTRSLLEPIDTLKPMQGRSSTIDALTGYSPNRQDIDMSLQRSSVAMPDYEALPIPEYRGQPVDNSAIQFNNLKRKRKPNRVLTEMMGG